MILAHASIAVSAVRANTMRSALTVLGIVIGVAAVIAMLAIGRGAEVWEVALSLREGLAPASGRIWATPPACRTLRTRLSCT